MLILGLFVSIMGVLHPYSGECGLLHAYSHGDIMIGGLFPMHRQTNRTSMPGSFSCTDFDFRQFLRSQVMIYAIREINQRTPRVLPNFTIGYDIYDTCGNVTFAIRATLQLLKNHSDPDSCLVPASFQSALPEPSTKALIGEVFSEVSIAVARVVTLSSVTQISYSSTSKHLSSKIKFPTFLRTIPSDTYQTKGIAKLVRKFNWKSVAIIGSDDEYGKYGSDSLLKNFREMQDICVEFFDILPGHFYLNNSETHTLLAELVSKLNKSSAEAIIVFTHDRNVAVIMEAAIKYNLNRIWIASDGWSFSEKISKLTGIERAGDVYGFNIMRNEVPGFKEYFISLFNGTNNALFEHYLTYYSFCSNQSGGSNPLLKNSQQGSMQCRDSNDFDTSLSFNVYLAVHAIAEGLRRLLKCDNHQCGRSTTFTTMELLMEIKNINITVNNTHLHFDDNGDPCGVGYDIVHWDMDEYKTIGEYWPNGTINVLNDVVKKMRNVTVTAYNCSKTCKPGQQLKRQSVGCCNDCVPCADGEFSTQNGEECRPCGPKNYSSQQRDKCLEKTVEFLNWSDPFVIFLTSIEVCGIILTIVFAIIFTIYRSTPVVKAVGGRLCFLELLSLLTCFCLPFFFAGEPTVGSCMVGLPVFGIAFSVCLSCILANLLQILVGFKFDLQEGSWMKKLNQPVAVVTILSLIQLAVCVSWLYFSRPIPHEEPSRVTILIDCNIGSIHFFVGMLCYNSFLGIICFLFAIKGKELPDLYKNASLIAVSMVLFLIVWIFCIPTYIRMTGKHKQAMKSVAILISSYSILGCHLAPKCYIMLFRKEINNENAITTYIRKHYEQRNMAVVRS